ncbi:MAG: TonB-dependent receptor [Gemmatimonadales bacterium]|nr:TonB-dependent receptor [Gemmatimonadales bacterium]
MIRWRAAAAGAVVVAVAAWAAPVRAQIPDALSDSVRADSIRSDSLRRVRDREFAERFVAEQEKGDVQLATYPTLAPIGPQASGARAVFTRDSLEWSQAQTIGDLLASVAGTYLWRGGWLGSAELVNYRARGAASVEYVLDGVPYTPLGPDSLAVDPSTLALSVLDRLEVERWPGLLRVHLFTRRHDRLAERSTIGLARGTNSLTRFQAEFETRSQRALGFGLAAEYFNTGVRPGTSGDYFRNTSAWLQLGWTTHPTRGALLQLVTTSPTRLSVTGLPDGPDALDGTRLDWLLRGYLRRRADGLGAGADLSLGMSQWGAEPSQSVASVTATLSLRSARAGGEVLASVRTRWTPVEVRARGGWSPSPALGVSGEAVFQLHEGARTSAWAGAQASFRLLPRLSLRGSARAGTVVASPAVESDASQAVLEAEAAAAWDSRWLSASAGVARTGSFRSPAFQPFTPVVTSLGEVPEAFWLSVRGRITPVNWLALEGWFEVPLDQVPVGQPTEHFVGMASVRSKFQRAFPSGVFDFKLSAGFERWGPSTIGFAADGAPVIQTSQNYLRLRAQVAIQSFTIYFEQANTLGMSTGYVPGFGFQAHPSYPRPIPGTIFPDSASRGASCRTA